MLSANLPFNSSLKDLVLRGSLVFHCSYINTVSVWRDATSKKPETISWLRRTKQMSHIKTKWTPTSSISICNTAQTVWIHPERIPDHSVCVLYVFSLCVYTHIWVCMCVGHSVTSMFWGTKILLPTQRKLVNGPINADRSTSGSPLYCNKSW